MSILDKIIENKKQEVATKKIVQPIVTLEMQPYFSRETFSLANQIRQSESIGIISEFKRKSPSKGILNDWSSIEEVTHDYVKAGVSGVSILTDEDYFGGSIEDLQTVRKHENCPILRKDFIIDEYQIYESKLIGADCILLIASILNDNELFTFSETAEKLGLDFIIEVHDENELSRVEQFSNALIGVNNRNLKTFEVDLNNSIKLKEIFKGNNIFIAESGIKSFKDIEILQEHNINVFLIGESLMKGDFFET